jgi:hypothetical protein
MKENIEIIEGMIEDSLINQDFMKEMFGSDIDYSLDHDKVTDTDMDKVPYEKEQVIFEIEEVDEDTMAKIVENNADELSEKVKEWAKQHSIDHLFDGVYTMENSVTLIFDVPEKKMVVKKAANGSSLGSSAPSMITDSFSNLKNIDVLKSAFVTAYIDELVEKIRKAGVEELNESFIVLDAIEKIAKEVKATIKDETIEYIEQTKDDKGLGVKLLVEERYNPNYEEDALYHAENKKIKNIQEVLEIRRKYIMDTVKKEVMEGKKPEIGYTTTKFIKPFYPKTAGDGAELEEIYEGSEEIDENVIVISPKTKESYKKLNSKLKDKYGVVLGDLDFTEEMLQEKMDSKMSESDIMSMLTKEYELTPVSPEKNKEIKNKDSEKDKSGHYICVLKNAKGEVIGKYEVAYKDDDYAKMFLETIGVTLKIGDKIDFE